MGWPEKSKKQSEKNSEKHIFSAEFFRQISSANFPCVFFRSENGKRRRKTVSQNFNIEIQHGMMIQSRIPTRWSCKPNQCAYGCSKQDLEKTNYFFNSQLCTPLPIKRKAHQHKQFCPVNTWVRGRLPTGWPGVKCSCAVCGIQGLRGVC